MDDDKDCVPDYIVAPRAGVGSATEQRFADNVYGDHCDKCGWEVYHRPHNPKGIPYMCMECAMAPDQIVESLSGMAVSETTADELLKEGIDVRRFVKDIRSVH